MDSGLDHGLPGQRSFLARSVTLMLTVFCLSWTHRVQAEASEFALKSAFIYNFAKFIEWPEQPDNLLRLCTLGEDPFGLTLDDLENKPIGSMKVKIVRLAGTENIQTCQILFISGSEEQNLPRILKAIQGVCVLTITDAKDFLDHGVMIEMLLEDERIAFEVNVSAARRANLIISSKLLRLAKRVY